MKTNKCLHSVALVSAALILCLIFVLSAASAATEQSASSTGPYAYVTNYGSDTVSVIDTVTDTVIATVPVGDGPHGVAVNPDGTKVYVTNDYDYNVSVIDTATNTVTATVPVGSNPAAVAVSPDGKKVYVTGGGWNVYVIDTVTNEVTATVPVGDQAYEVAVSPDGTKVYVTNQGGQSVSVLDTATNTVITTLRVGLWPSGIVVSPDGTKVYVGIEGSNAVSVIDTATNTVTAMVNVGGYPEGVAVNPAGTKVYVVGGSSNVSVIDTATNTVTDTVDAKSSLRGIAVNSYGTKVYATTWESSAVSVIDTATDTVTATVPVGYRSCGVAVGPALKPVLPVANFSANPISGTAPLNVSFTDTSTGTPTSWSWNFGDRTNSTIQNPTHKYSRVGNYTVVLTATNAAGNNTITKKSYIKVTAAPPTPVANFTSNLTNGSAPLTVQFTDLSKNAISWEWNFGDRTNSTVQNPTHKYSRVGNYTVALTATNALGNSTLIKKSYIKVAAATPKPVANFTSNVTSGSAPLTVQFTDLSKYTTSWSWSFGDRTNSTVQNPTHKYSRAGNYTVALTATNAVGNNTITKKSYIKVK